LLAADTYTVTLRSAASAFRDAGGRLLDGNSDGLPGGDHVTTFTVAPPAATAVTVSLPDFARGFGQTVNVPATGAGLPLSLSTGRNVSGVNLTLRYDPALLTVTGFTLAPALTTAGVQATVNTATPGQAFLQIHHTAELTGIEGTLVLGTFAASVPTNAPYGGKQTLTIESLAVFDAAAGTPQPRAAVADAAVHVAAFAGDASGNAILQANDAILAARIATSVNSGATALRLADPTIGIDISGDGAILANDATAIARAAIGAVVPEIPTVTAGTRPTPTGRDPILKIGTASGAPGATVLVPVTLQIPAGEAATAFSGFDIVVGFDATKVAFASASAATFTAGLTFQVNTGLGAGLVAISGFTAGKTASLTSTDGATVIANLSFTIVAGATAGPTAVNLRADDGGLVTTAVFDDAAVATILAPAPTNGTDAGDGSITVFSSPQVTIGGTLAGLSAVYGTASSVTTLTVSGTALIGDVTATAPAGFEVSADNVSFGTMTSFVRSNGAASGTLYVRLAAKTRVGSYAGVVSFASANWDGATTTVATSTVTPKTLTVTANNSSRTYGRNNPTLSAVFSGFVAGETAATAVAGQPLVTTAATSASGVGSYPITPSIGSLTATNGNYAFTFVAGTLTVSKANLTVTLDNRTKVVGQPDPNFTFAVAGLVNGDTAAGVLTGAATRGPGETAADYTISKGTLALQSSGAALNYNTPTFTNGTLRILAAAKPLFVSGVFVRGSAWNDNYLGLPSFATASGGTRLGFALGDGTTQLANSRLVTWNNVNRVSVRFSEAINAPAAGSLTLIAVTGAGVGTQTTVTSTAVTLAEGNTVATWTVPTLASGKYQLVLRSSAITAATGGGQLDGDWTNASASSTFANGSGNGTAGGDFEYRFNVLVGDMNTSGSVLAGDRSAVQSALGSAVTTTNFRLDLNGSNSIVLATDVNPFTAANGPLAGGTTSLTNLANSFSAPALTAAAGATVDAAFDVTFTDNAAWRAAITGIRAGATAATATAIPAAAWTAAAGRVTLDPALATQLQTSGNRVIVISATGYADVTVTQALGVGAAAKLGIATQPVGPTTNGGALATQPVVRIQDKYGNTVTTSTAAVTAAVESGTGAWTLGGTLLRSAVAGTATFSGLSATRTAGSVTGARIRFTSGTLTLVVSNEFTVP